MIRLDLASFEDFCLRLTIPSKDYGDVPFRWWGTQRYEIREIAKAIEDGIHDVVVLKGGRQIGGSTLSDAFSLYWPQSNAGTQGMMVAEEDKSMKYRRDLLREMHASMPREYKRPIQVDNQGMMRFDNGSRLQFMAAGLRSSDNLGRGRGISFLHADEVGGWGDLHAVSSLRNALSKKNPLRLYLWNGTARGIGTPWHDMWKTAERVSSQRAVFVAWWRHDDYKLTRPSGVSEAIVSELWDSYGVRRPDEDERIRIRIILERYGVKISQEQVAWWRWQLDAEQHGDEAMMLQEFGWLPEECWQAFGDHFISASLLRSMRLDLADAPEPDCFVYQWGATIEDVQLEPRHIDESDLTVWEQPDEDGAYVVAGHPGWSSSAEADQFVAQVWRVWPDHMVQVAEYASDDGHMYQFAWLLLHLCGAYRTPHIPAYFIVEVSMTGYKVLDEILLLERHGYGLSKKGRGNVQDFLTGVRHYFYYKPDAWNSKSAPIAWKTHHDNRPWILHGLRDTLERGHMTVRSPELIDALDGLRRGESGDSDVIAGAGGTSDARVICASLAVQCWLHTAVPELENMLSPRVQGPASPKSAEQRLIQNYLGDILSR